MSRRIAVEQRRYASGMADTQGLQQGVKLKLLLRPYEDLYSNTTTIL